jgi:phosphoadenosine phosphosulfate reductase
MDNWQDEYLLYSRLPIFQKRINEANNLILQALSMGDFWYLACSFGKDSLCLLDLIVKIKPNIPVLHMDSGYCFPETYETRGYYQNKMSLNLTIKPAPIDYFDLMRDFGIPSVNRTKSQQINIVKMLKKDTSLVWARQNGLNGVFLGLRKDEANGRKLILNLKSPIYQLKNDLWKANPLANWSFKDIWAYILSNNLKYPEFYDKTGLGRTREWIRNSSWCTTDGAERGQVVWLKHYYPDLYRKLVKAFPEISRYS